MSRDEVVGLWMVVLAVPLTFLTALASSAISRMRHRSRSGRVEGGDWFQEIWEREEP